MVWNRNKAKPKDNLTQDDLRVREEWRTIYRADIRRFFKDCLRIKYRDNPNIRAGAFILNDAQEAILRTLERIQAFNEERRAQAQKDNPDQPIPPFKTILMILKQRQGGVSTFCEGLAFHRGEFYPRTNALCMAHRKDGAINIARIARSFHTQFPPTNPDIRIEIKRNSADILEWEEAWDSRIVVATGGDDEAVTRSFSYDFIHFSEVAHFPSPDPIAATLFTAPAGSLVLQESTANGIDHSFYPAWQDALPFEVVYRHWKDCSRVPEKWNGNYRFFWGWWQDRGYTVPLTRSEHDFLSENLTEYEKELQERYTLSLGQVQWRRNRILNECQQQSDMDPEDYFRQEMPANPDEAFVASGNAVFNQSRLIRLEAQSRDITPKWHGAVSILEGGDYILQDRSGDHEYSPLVLWEEPKKGYSYIIGVDTAEGREEGDYSVISVFNRTDGEQLIEAARFRGKLPPRQTGELAFYLGQRFNHAFIIPEANPPGNATVQRLVELRYPYLYHRRNEELIGGTLPDEHFTAGFRTLKNTKALVINHAEAILREGLLCLKSSPAIREWRMYTRTEQKYGAPPGHHDDCVMADALAIYAHRVAAPPVLRLVEEKKSEEFLPENLEKEYADDIRRKIRKQKAFYEKMWRKRMRIAPNPFF